MTNENSRKAERDSGIELLRILSILCVIILHYNHKSMGGAFGFVADRSINQFILIFFECIAISAVNLFILISGYYMCRNGRRKLSKIIELFIQEIVIKLMIYFVRVIFGSVNLSARLLIEAAIPNNYFVILYATLYVVSPYINVVTRKLSLSDLKKLVITVFVVFSCWTIIVDIAGNMIGMNLRGLSTIGADGSQKGFTIINFGLMYLLGTYLCYLDENKKTISIKKSSYVLILSIGILYLWSIMEHILKLPDVVAWNYNNPLIVIIPACIFIVFKSMSLHSRTINELAKACFICFLFHSALLKYCHIEWAAASNPFILMIHILLIPVLLFLISYVLYFLYKKSIGILANKASSKFDVIKIGFELEE